MNIRIIHTGDNHLGMKFNGRNYSAAVREALVQERYDALARTVAIANEKGTHFLIIAGDLFDSVQIAEKDIRKAAEILGQFHTGQLIIIPGNHDYFEAGPNKLWHSFRSYINENLLVFLPDCRIYKTEAGDRSVCFYPGPCHSKTSDKNNIGWVKETAKEPNTLHIGIAHGSMKGFSLDLSQKDTYFPMTEQELKATGADFWLLGHTHVRYPAQAQRENPVFFFPSTPSPDGFDRKHEGFVWFLEIDENKNITMESMRTGAYRFYEIDKIVLQGAEDIKSLKTRFDGLEKGKSLVKMKLEGRLSEEDKNELAVAIQLIKSELAYLELEENIKLNITREHIGKRFTPNSLPYRLLTRLSDVEEDGDALQIANDILEKLKG